VKAGDFFPCADQTQTHLIGCVVIYLLERGAFQLGQCCGISMRMGISFDST